MNIKIKKWGTKVLFEKSEEVDVNIKYPEEVVGVARFNNPNLYCIDCLKMVTKRERNSLGICAPQIGISKRILVVDPPDKKMKVMVNPKIVERSGGKFTAQEGCLSLPKIFVNVKRDSNIIVEYLDENFKEQMLEAIGVESRIIQHEIDHLDGKCIIDYLGTVQRSRAIACLKKNKIFEG